jgi:hypothetical protein
MTIILRVFVAAVLLALMSLSGVNAARAVLHGADREASAAARMAGAEAPNP